MITEIQITNYKSIAEATIKLSKFTLLIGANGAGKSNFLNLLKKFSSLTDNSFLDKHLNLSEKEQQFIIKTDNNKKISIYEPSNISIDDYADEIISIETADSFKKDCSLRNILSLKNVVLFSLNPANAGNEEALIKNPIINEDGAGAVQVLESLKTGDREDLFNTIEEKLKEFIPEVEKLSFIQGEKGKQLQIREKGLNKPMPVANLSEGTQLAIIILTILYQLDKPSIICLEEIDRSLHPWLYGKIINLCREMSKLEDMPQIIATTHNPYIVDLFKENEEEVVIVEKKDGKTSFETLKERLIKFENEKEEIEELLGEIWYGGYLGGVPNYGYNLNPEELAEVSDSFNIFKRQVESWQNK